MSDGLDCESDEAWRPTGRARTPSYARRRSNFSKQSSKTATRYDGSTYTTTSKNEVSIADARARLQREIELLGASRIVLSTNVELRLDGLPRSGRNAPSDPGVALYFFRKGKPIVFACDTFTTVAANIAAISAHVGAMRAMERYGVGTLDQAFAGYTALPGGLAVMDWRGALGNPRTRAEAEDYYRTAIRSAHPDVGGSEAKASMLNAAIAEARKTLS